MILRFITYTYIIILVGCGVKASPQPPLTPEEQLQYEKEQKAKTEKREKQLKAIAERNKKLEEEKAAKQNQSNGN